MVIVIAFFTRLCKYYRVTHKKAKIGWNARLNTEVAGELVSVHD